MLSGSALGKAWVLHEVMSKDSLFTNFDLPWMRYKGIRGRWDLSGFIKRDKCP